MIKAICLDLGKVVVNFDYRVDVLARIIEGFDGKVAPVFEALGFTHLGDGTQEVTYERIDTGEIPHRQLWQTVYQRGGISPDKMPIELFTLLSMNHLKPFLPVVELIKKLQRQYKIVAVSNGPFDVLYLCELLRIESGIQWAKVFVSAEYRLKKPGLLDNVVTWLKEEGITPAETVFVDDIQKYVDAALKRNFGGAVLFDASKESAEILEQKLVELGVCV